MRLAELGNSPESQHAPEVRRDRPPLHGLAVDEAMREMLRSYPELASDAPALLSHGRSAWETVHNHCTAGRFQPPPETCNHGAVGLVTGLEDGEFDKREVRATLLCAPNEIILFAIVHRNTYQALLCNACVQSRAQSALFVDKRRSGLYYSTVRGQYNEQQMDTPEPPFWVSIPNGLAFLRIETAEGRNTQGSRCPFDLNNTGIFRYYDGKPYPKLRTVLQVEGAAEYLSRWEWPEVRNREPASLDALLTFLVQRPSEAVDESGVAEEESRSLSPSWAGASEGAQTATGSEAATVVAEHLVALERVSSDATNVRRVLCRLKRALEVDA
jgi:hypothetical protein